MFSTAKWKILSKLSDNQTANTFGKIYWYVKFGKCSVMRNSSKLPCQNPTKLNAEKHLKLIV